MTYTVAALEVSDAVFDEIRQALRDAGQLTERTIHWDRHIGHKAALGDSIDNIGLDMTHIAIVRRAPIVQPTEVQKKD